MQRLISVLAVAPAVAEAVAVREDEDDCPMALLALTALMLTLGTDLAHNWQPMGS
jgi:hypothetical protein